MKRTSLWAVLSACVMAGSALAGEPGKCGTTTASEKAKCTKSAELVSGKDSCKSKVDESVAKVLASMPSLQFKAGDTVTPCEKTAIAAAGDESKLQYVVGDRTFGCRIEAMSSLAAMMEQEVDKLMVVSYVVGDKCVGCPMAAKALAASGTKMSYRLAGVDFASAEEATKAKERIEAALAARSGKSDCCKKGDAQTASAVAAKKGCCKDGQSVQTASAEAAKKDGCSGTKAVVTASAEAGKKGCCKEGATAQTASAEATKKGGCQGAAAQTASSESETKSGCNKAAAQTASATAKSGCCKGAAAQTASSESETKSGCGKSNAQTASATAKSGCCKGTGDKTTLASGSAMECGSTAQYEQRIEAVHEKVRVIVETAVAVNS